MPSNPKMKETIKITKERLISLLIDEEELSRLHNGGVSNWDWYGASLNDTGESFSDYEDRVYDIVLDAPADELFSQFI